MAAALREEELWGQVQSHDAGQQPLEHTRQRTQLQAMGGHSVGSVMWISAVPVILVMTCG